ncbi:MAG TPA: transposase [Oligoflexus sp.]|uniref:transposase n=1 Tax=Oligoflexus sp. TaxID=1971216 RepID=UPI002D5212E6|nr:transposase [Oligoflexus sp.]HYX37341.1 transposase [Oligoflexus sp.]
MSKTQLIMGVERRRKFPDEEKARIVSEMAETSMTAVSKKHGIAMSALSKGKKRFPTIFLLLESIEIASACPGCSRLSVDIPGGTTCSTVS